MNSIFVICLMLFMHVLDDYVLQAPCLCNLKQKSFWEKNAPEKSYRFDYIVALIMHAFSWSFMIMLPIAISQGFDVNWVFGLMLVINIAVHAFVDNLKANVKVINLWVDQSIHMLQIIYTFWLFIGRFL